MPNKLQELFNEYEDRVQHTQCLRPSTIRGYKAVFNLFIKLMPSITCPEQINERVLTDFFKIIRERSRPIGDKTRFVRGVKPSTIKTLWWKLSAFFEWLEARGYIKENPLWIMPSPRVEYKDYRRLNDEEIKRIYSSIVLSSTNSFLMRRDTLIISLLVYCGLRKGELLALKVIDIDRPKKLLTVEGATSKSKFTRMIPIHPTLLLHFDDYIKERNRRGLKTEYLIASNKKDRGMTEHGIKHWVKKMIKRSGVRFHLHRFRHTFACKLIEKDVEVTKVQKLMGHSSIMMTEKYTRSIRSEDLGEDLNKISY